MSNMLEATCRMTKSLPESDRVTPPSWIALVEKPWLAFSTLRQCSRVAWNRISGQRSMVRSRLTRVGAR